MQPAFQDGVRAEAGGFARENDENRLRDFLGVGGFPRPLPALVINSGNRIRPNWLAPFAYRSGPPWALTHRMANR